MESAGLYIHVPFCTSVCPYCDFAVTIAGVDRRNAYLDALELEIEHYGDVGLRFDTVYLGGGTPSSLTPPEIGRILGSVDRLLDFDEEAVRHLEANPEDVTAKTASEWRSLGFDFVSVGTQSFDDDALVFLGRRHDALQARRAIGLLIDAGFSTVSSDLIFGLPGQTATGWRRQLETALATGAQHLSCYQLTTHGGTIFGNRRRRGELDEPAESKQAELYLLTHEVLADAGWVGYEVSNFARTADHRSIHNRKYWSHEPYLGIGPSAHSFDGRRRWWNRRKVRLWSADLERGRSPVDGDEVLTDTQLFSEAVMLGLRTADGIDLGVLGSRFGNEVVSVDETAVERLVETGHLRREGLRLAPTARGMAIADHLARSLLP
jgi:oxygen-independent coproporphyrinogen-3 oxidase